MFSLEIPQVSNGDFNLLNEFSKVKNWKCDSFFFLIVSGELGGNVTDRKQGSGMFGQRGPRKTPAPARKQKSFVLCICVFVLLYLYLYLMGNYRE